MSPILPAQTAGVSGASLRRLPACCSVTAR